MIKKNHKSDEEQRVEVVSNLFAVRGEVPESPKIVVATTTEREHAAITDDDDDRGDESNDGKSKAPVTVDGDDNSVAPAPPLSKQSDLVDALHGVVDGKKNLARASNFMYKQEVAKLGEPFEVRDGCRLAPRDAKGDAALVVALRPHAALVTSGEKLSDVLNAKNMLKKPAEASALIRQVKLKSHHPNYKHGGKFHGLTREKTTAASIKFEKDGRRVTVAQHFEEQYGIKLQHPEWPLLYRNRRYFPLELYSIQKDQLVQASDGAVLSRSTMAPGRFMQSVLEKLEWLDLGVSKSKKKQPWYIDNTPIVVPATVLPTPPVEFGGKKSQRAAHWNWTKLSLLQPVSSHGKLVVVIPKGAPFAAKNVVEPVNKALRSFRISSSFSIASSLKEALDQKPSLVMVLLDDEKKYGQVKRQCDSNGVPSQCVAKFGSPLAPGHAANIALKINGKLGGINYAPLLNKLETDRVLFLGVDVYHTPSSGQIDGVESSDDNNAAAESGRKPSMVALVGMHGDKLQHCETALHLARTGGQEVVVNDFDVPLRRIVERYQKQHKSLPSRVYFLRDGVSESQYDAVLTNEVEKGVCAVLPDARVTALVATKRHNVRFVQQTDDDKVGNLQSGTLVSDERIQRRAFDDFFLQSYEAIRTSMTSRATLYTLLRDDGFERTGARRLALAKLLYKLTFAQQRASGAVALPAPVAAADLLAYRARFYCQDDDRDVLNRLEALPRPYL